MARLVEFVDARRSRWHGTGPADPALESSVDFYAGGRRTWTFGTGGGFFLRGRGAGLSLRRATPGELRGFAALIQAAE